MTFWVQAGYRFYDDDAPPDSATPLAALNTSPATIALDKTFFIRFLVQNTGAGDQTLENLQLRYRIDKGAGWTAWDIVSIQPWPSRAVLITASDNIANGESISQLLGSGTFRDGEAYDNARESPTGQLANTQGSDEYEVVFSLQLDSDATTTPAAVGDKVQFQMRVDEVGFSTVELDQYDHVPEITVGGNEVLAAVTTSFSITMGNVVGFTSNAPFWQLGAFQFFNDDGPPDVATALAGISNNIAIPTNQAFRFHALIQNTGAGPSDPTFRLQYRINAGAWTDFGLEGNPDDPIRLRLTDQIVNNSPMAQRIGTGTFVAGEAYDDDRATGVQPTSNGGDEYEFQWNMEVDAESAGIVPQNGDTIEIKLLVNTGAGEVDLDNVPVVPTITVTAQAQPNLAFPSAIGYGRLATGGRGGALYIVTSSADSGPGTFREAVTASGPRIIIFEVNEIRLASNLTLSNGDVSIFGQSMPGGVQISDAQFNIRCENFIIRGIMWRPGDRIDVNPSTGNKDGFLIGDSLDNPGDTGAVNGVIDHCVMQWATDGNVDFWRHSRDITLMNSIICQGLENPANGFTRSPGNNLFFGNVASQSWPQRITLARNLIAFGNARNPEIKTLPDEIEVLNNYVYYPGEQYRTLTSQPDANRVTVRANVFRSGPQTTQQSLPHIRFHNSDSYALGNEQYTGDGSPWPGGGDDWHGNGTILSQQNFPGSGAPILPASQVEAHVLANCGAYPDNPNLLHAHAHDSAAQSVIDHATNYTGKRFWDTPEDAGGWPDMSVFSALPDSDQDGIPNLYESQFSNLEDYLNFIYGDGPAVVNETLNATATSFAITGVDVVTRTGPDEVLIAQPTQFFIVGNDADTQELVGRVSPAVFNITGQNAATVVSQAGGAPGAIVWPGTLPGHLLGSMQLDAEEARSGFQPDLGPPLTHKTTTKTGEAVRLSYRLTDAELATFRTFWKSTDYGAKDFEFTHPLDGTTRTARFSDEYSSDLRGPDHNLVRVSLYLDPL